MAENLWIGEFLNIFVCVERKLKRKFIISLIFACLIGITCMAVASDYKVSEIRNDIETSISGRLTDSVIPSGNAAFAVPQTECRVPRQSNAINCTRTITQTVRTNGISSSRGGFTMTKSGKLMNPHTTSLFFESINLFPSGLTESSHHLISLGKLII